jgi:hypothetical protein
MSQTHIPKDLRERVSRQACHRCGYCLTAEAIVGAPMEVDHIIPESLGGATEEQNLWLACSLCNDHKANRIAALDPETETVVRLFDPRREVWCEHFQWTAEGDRVIGSTPTGRATVIALHLNRASLVRARRLWVAVGWHPPTDAPAGH